MEAKVVTFENGIVPTKGTCGSAGWDLYSPKDTTVPKMSTVKVELNIILECPSGYFAVLKDRSSVASRGIEVVGGVIDSDYRGEIILCLRNHTLSDYVITAGQRIGQMIFFKSENITIVLGSNLSQTERGTGGFGSTD